MKKSILIFIMILGITACAGFNACAAVGPSDIWGISEGPGKNTIPKGNTGPALHQESVKTEDTQLSSGTSDSVTQAGSALAPGTDPTELGVDTVETVVAAVPALTFEQKVALDHDYEPQQRPKTGELYHSDHYFSSSATINISNDGKEDTVMKFFEENGDLVSIVYLRSAEKMKINLPGGHYYMKQAFGENWYGLDNMFGYCGRYCECTIGGVSVFQIKRAGSYLIATSGTGDPFSKTEVSKERF